MPLAFALACGWLSLSPHATAQPVLVTNLYAFQGQPDGSDPISLTYGAGGVLFGIAFEGGANNTGAIFKLNPDGTGERILHSFGLSEGGGNPFLNSLGFNLTVLQGNDGMLYGTTFGGGANGDGSVFRLFPDGSGYTVLHSFTNGDSGPLALIQGKDGALYGAGGTIFLFKLDTSGSNYVVLYSGGTTNGISPYGLMQEEDGALYGTAYQTANAPGGGAVFKLATNGVYTLLHTFSGGASDGLFPLAAPFQATNGALYGTTMQGGSNNLGIVYRINPDGGGYQVLHSFGAAGDGGSAAGRLVQGPGNVLFGTTYQYPGRIFKIGLDGGDYQVFAALTGTGLIGPVAGLVPGPASGGSGAFFGVTSQTSPSGEKGMVFAMLVNPPATITPLTGQTAGGQLALFWPSWAIGYVLQTTTNLASGNWVTASNAIPLTGAQVTNNSQGAFFRLAWPQ